MYTALYQNSPNPFLDFLTLCTTVRVLNIAKDFLTPIEYLANTLLLLLLNVPSARTLNAFCSTQVLNIARYCLSLNNDSSTKLICHHMRILCFMQHDAVLVDTAEIYMYGYLYGAREMLLFGRRYISWAIEFSRLIVDTYRDKTELSLICLYKIFLLHMFRVHTVWSLADVRKITILRAPGGTKKLRKISTVILDVERSAWLEPIQGQVTLQQHPIPTEACAVLNRICTLQRGTKLPWLLQTMDHSTWVQMSDDAVFDLITSATNTPATYERPRYLQAVEQIIIQWQHVQNSMVAYPSLLTPSPDFAMFMFRQRTWLSGQLLTSIEPGMKCHTELSDTLNAPLPALKVGTSVNALYHSGELQDYWRTASDESTNIRDKLILLMYAITVGLVRHTTLSALSMLNLCVKKIDLKKDKRSRKRLTAEQLEASWIDPYNGYWKGSQLLVRDLSTRIRLCKNIRRLVELRCGSEGNLNNMRVFQVFEYDTWIDMDRTILKQYVRIALRRTTHSVTAFRAYRGLSRQEEDRLTIRIAKVAGEMKKVVEEAVEEKKKEEEKEEEEEEPKRREVNETMGKDEGRKRKSCSADVVVVESEETPQPTKKHSSESKILLAEPRAISDQTILDGEFDLIASDSSLSELITDWDGNQSVSEQDLQLVSGFLS